jgi:hypothetical protein
MLLFGMHTVGCYNQAALVSSTSASLGYAIMASFTLVKSFKVHFVSACDIKERKLAGSTIYLPCHYLHLADTCTALFNSWMLVAYTADTQSCFWAHVLAGGAGLSATVAKTAAGV